MPAVRTVQWSLEDNTVGPCIGRHVKVTQDDHLDSSIIREASHVVNLIQIKSRDIDATIELNGNNDKIQSFDSDVFPNNISFREPLAMLTEGRCGYNGLEQRFM